MTTLLHMTFYLRYAFFKPSMLTICVSVTVYFIRLCDVGFLIFVRKRDAQAESFRSCWSSFHSRCSALGSCLRFRV